MRSLGMTMNIFFSLTKNLAFNICPISEAQKEIAVILTKTLQPTIVQIQKPNKYAVTAIDMLAPGGRCEG